MPNKLNLRLFQFQKTQALVMTANDRLMPQVMVRVWVWKVCDLVFTRATLDRPAVELPSNWLVWWQPRLDSGYWSLTLLFFSKRCRLHNLIFFSTAVDASALSDRWFSNVTFLAYHVYSKHWWTADANSSSSSSFFVLNLKLKDSHH